MQAPWHSTGTTLKRPSGEVPPQAAPVTWQARRLLNPKAQRYRNTNRFGRDLLRHHLRALLTRRVTPAGAVS